jgi:hypothetical protein
MTEDEIEALVEARVLAVRAGWQRQAKEKIAEALAAGIAEGLQRGAEGPQRGAEGRHVNVDGDKKTVAGDGGRALVKLLVEEAYRLVKKEFVADGEREIVSRIKGVLLAANEVLLRKVPAMLPSPAPNPSNYYPSLSSGVLGKRAFKLRLSSVAPPLSWVALVDIPTTLERSKPRSMFNRDSGSITFYLVKITIFLIGKNGQVNTAMAPIVHSQHRRHSEFQALFRDLKRESPTLWVPTPATSSITLASDNPNQVDQKSKVERRRLMLSVWLQSVYNHGVLQQSPSLLAFVTGGGPKTDRDSLGLYRDGNTSSNGTSTQGLPRGREEKGASSAFVAEECEKRLAFLSPPQPPPEVFSSIQFARELAREAARAYGEAHEAGFHWARRHSGS